MPYEFNVHSIPRPEIRQRPRAHETPEKGGICVRGARELVTRSARCAGARTPSTHMLQFFSTIAIALAILDTPMGMPTPPDGTSECREKCAGSSCHTFSNISNGVASCQEGCRAPRNATQTSDEADTFCQVRATIK